MAKLRYVSVVSTKVGRHFPKQSAEGYSPCFRWMVTLRSLFPYLAQDHLCCFVPRGRPADIQCRDRMHLKLLRPAHQTLIRFSSRLVKTATWGFTKQVFLVTHRNHCIHYFGMKEHIFLLKSTHWFIQKLKMKILLSADFTWAPCQSSEASIIHSFSSVYHIKFHELSQD